MSTAHAPQLIVFLLVFARVSGTLAAAPIFSERALPVQVRLGFSALVAFLLTPGQIPLTTPISNDPIEFLVLVGQQILLGLAFALVLTAVFGAAEAAGEIIGEQMGITLGTFSASNQEQTHTIGAMYRVVAALIFLSLDGQHWVVLGIGSSLQALPVTQVALSPHFIGILFSLGGLALQFAIGLALPLMVTLLLADLITGLIGRAIPSLNLFVLGLPLKVTLAIVGITLAAPFTVIFIAHVLQQIPQMSLW